MLRLKRESFASRIGFLLVSAGCAIGIGNVWRFPTVTGQYGGGVFVLFYLLFLVLMGAPVLTMELAVGRAGHGSAGTAYRALEPKGSKWHLHGWACLIGCCVLMMYYTTVSGWMLAYFFRFVKGTFTGLAADAVSGVYADLLADPFEQIVWMAITVLLGFFVCSRGLQNGIERIGKWMMGALFVLILVLAVHSFVLPGAGEGLAFYLLPDWNRAAEMGIGNVIVAAMNQAFFTLSLGVGAMEIFGSYMSRDYTLAGEALRICALDTCVAICSGLIIFPACFTYDLEVTAGPSLLFDTMASVFTHIPGGRWWGALFFLFMVFAALSTVLGVCENILAMIRELTGWSRPKGCAICGVGIFALALTTALGYSVLHFQPFAPGTAWLDFWDFVVSNNVLPLGSLVLALFCCNRFGWGWDNFVAEANTGRGLKVRPWMKPIFRYFVPGAILFIYIYGMVTFHWR